MQALQVRSDTCVLPPQEGGSVCFPCVREMRRDGAMAEGPEESLGQPEEEWMRVQDWRLSTFERLGFSPFDAMKLEAAKADTHKAEDLLSSGCSLELVLSILT